MKNLVNAEVIYKDTVSNKVVYGRNISGQINQPVNPKNYKQYVPSNYQFEGYGHFDRYLKNGGVNVIYVKKATNKVNNSPKGIVMVDYINSNNQLVGHKMLSNNVGKPFNANQWKSTLPKGYRLNRVLTGGNINAFKAQSQIMVVQVAKVQRAHVIVKYVDRYNKFVGSIKSHMKIGEPFNVGRYLNTVPVGYQFVKVNGPVPKDVKHDLMINVEVAPKQSFHRSQAQNSSKSNRQNAQISNDGDESAKKIGTILMKLASSLHDLGLSISKDHKL